MGRGPQRTRGNRAPAGPDFRWVIDTHGLKAVLESPRNALRASIIDAIQSGQMRLLRSVAKEIEMYDHLRGELQQIRPKRYVDVSVAAQARSGILMEQFGASPFGGQPMVEHFEAVAATISDGFQLVTAGKALRQCSRIVDRCGAGDVISVDDF